MSGECKSYRLNEPMSFKEFKAMPDDIQETYIKALREKYNVSDAQLAKMFGVAKATASVYLRKKGFNRSGKFSGREEWDKEGFYAWAYGVPKQEDKNLKEILAECNGEDVEMYETVEEIPAEVEQEPEITAVPCEPVKEEHTEEAPHMEPIPNLGIKVNLVNAADEPSPAFAIPTTGSMTFEGDALDILRSISRLLGGAKVLLSVKWDVVED